MIINLTLLRRTLQYHIFNHLIRCRDFIIENVAEQRIKRTRVRRNEDEERAGVGNRNNIIKEHDKEIKEEHIKGNIHNSTNCLK